VCADGVGEPGHTIAASLIGGSVPQTDSTAEAGGLGTSVEPPLGQPPGGGSARLRLRRPRAVARPCRAAAGSSSPDALRVVRNLPGGVARAALDPPGRLLRIVLRLLRVAAIRAVCERSEGLRETEAATQPLLWGSAAAQQRGWPSGPAVSGSHDATTIGRHSLKQVGDLHRSCLAAVAAPALNLDERGFAVTVCTRVERHFPC